MFNGQTQYFLLGDSTKGIERKIGCLEKCGTLKFVVIYFVAYSAIKSTVSSVIGYLLRMLLYV
jgi:hypothetical protein